MLAPGLAALSLLHLLLACGFCDSDCTFARQLHLSFQQVVKKKSGFFWLFFSLVAIYALEKHPGLDPLCWLPFLPTQHHWNSSVGAVLMLRTSWSELFLFLCLSEDTIARLVLSVSHLEASHTVCIKAGRACAKFRTHLMSGKICGINVLLGRMQQTLRGKVNTQSVL